MIWSIVLVASLPSGDLGGLDGLPLMGQKPVNDLSEAVAATLQGKVTLDPGPPFERKFTTAVGVEAQANNAIGDRLGAGAIDVERAIASDLGDRASVAADHGGATTQRLGDRHPEPLEPGRL